MIKPKTKSSRGPYLAAGALGIALWLVIVIASGTGLNLFPVHWNFANTGSFGDSFGPLGALMAGMAAIAAFETLREQRAEFRRIAKREEDEDKRREALDAIEERQRRLRQASESRQLFERTFFNMLEALREIVKETDVGSGDSRKVSRDAFKRLADHLNLNTNSTKSLQKAWAYLIRDNKNDLNHYFRFLYHVVRYVDLQEAIDRYSYIRLLRASLSEAELILLFANCAVGEGHEKFKPLVEKYALLHNVSPGARTSWSMDVYFSPFAFDYGE